MKSNIFAVTIISAIFINGFSYAEEKEKISYQKMHYDLFFCGYTYKNAYLSVKLGNKDSASSVKEAEECSSKSKDNVKALVKKELAKLSSNKSATDKLKSLYAAYLTYMDRIVITSGAALGNSIESKSFEEKANDYKVELELSN